MKTCESYILLVVSHQSAAYSMLNRQRHPIYPYERAVNVLLEAQEISSCPSLSTAAFCMVPIYIVKVHYLLQIQIQLHILYFLTKYDN